MTESQTKNKVHDELAAAHRALEDAKLLVREERAESSISRAYYAIFHAARAILYTHQSSPITHRGVKSAFGLLVVKPGLVEEEYNSILQEARDQRQVADYETGERDLLPSVDLASDIVAKAERFVKRIEKLVE